MMIKQMKMGLIALVGVVIWGFAPGVVHAAKTHTFACNTCHRSAANPRTMGNLCVVCHIKNGESVNPAARFNVGTASNALGHNGSPGSGSGAETSHFWGGNSTTEAAAGSANPPTTFYTSRYAISTNLITCTICHDPHGEQGTKLVRAAIAGDLICQQCHQQWFVDNADASLTHPIMADYAARAAAANAAAVAAGEPQDRFKLVVDNSLAGGLNGNIQLVNNGTTDGVTCSSCHGVHYADSDSASADTKESYASLVLSAGDGKLLRTDGVSSANKSALCQACHNYRPHGDSGAKHAITAIPGVTATTTVGCLECHSGHSYNNGNVQFYVLRSQIGAPYNATFTAPYDYAVKPASHDQTTPWQDGAGSNGYCEKCHGDADLIPGSQHTNAAKCMICHFHNSSPTGYSFEPGANVKVCGDCHGFPPHIDARGDRVTAPSYEGGYAYIAAANNYSLASNYKNEANTPHNAHAAAGVLYDASHPTLANQPIGLATDYRMGDGEVACSTCHGVRPSHNTGTTAVMGTYENLEFDSRATVDGQVAPAYDGAGRETCNNIYCHSNGGRRAGDSPTEATRIWSFIETPYTGNPTNSGWKNGKGKLIGTGSECSTCHGNSTATMDLTTGRKNSQTHNKHLNKGYTCNVCHVNTATNNTTVPAVARDVSKNAGDPTKGTHVNQKVDVAYDPAFTPAIGTGTYTAAAGTCSVYCHSDGNSNFYSADWDVAASGACNTCHPTTAISSGAHSKHIAATGANIKCDSCHGANAALGTHAGHVDGTIYYDTAACDTCHGVEAGEGGTPVWSNVPASQNLHCETCHIGALRTSYTDASSVVRTAPNKATATSLGHNRPTASGAYPVSGNAAANQACASCHDSTFSATHTDAPKGDQRLIGGFSCATCHASINTHQAKACVACHDPHGSGANIYMVRGTNSTDFGGTVVFTATSGADSYDEVDVNNTDDICATCHTATTHNNRARTGTHLDAQTHEGQDCFSCHKSHTDAAPFSGAGNACNGCHGNPPATGAHARHALVASHDKDIEDRSDCAFCHTGANLYTYNPSTDQGSSLNHSNAAGRKTILGTTVGYVVANGTCTSACHTSTAGTDGFWSDANGLNCTACHGNPPAGNNHGKHNTAGMICAGCHVGVDAAGTSPLTHADLGDTTGTGDDPATDILKIQHKGNAYVNVSGLDAELDDSAWNVGAGTTFVNGAGTTNNTCSNTLCHDPSNSGTIADWDSSTATCTLCHGAGTTMTTGSHANHLNNAAVIGDNFACTVCHPDNSVAGTDHTLTGGNVQGVITVAGSKVNTYGGEVNLPSSAYGTCTASQCHNDGKGANVTSPAWGRVPQSGDNCTICHAAPPANGDHSGHWVAGRQLLGLGCTSCHNSTTATDSTIKAGSLHLDGNSYNVAAGGNYNAVAVTISSYVQGIPSTCTASCHSANPKNWAPATSCNGCHGNPPATGAHAKHTTVTDQTTGEDRTDCAQCHPGADTYTYSAGGTHQDTGLALGLTTLNASIVNMGGGNYSCNTLCHLSSAGDGSWTDAGGLNCDACHYYSATPSGANNLAHAKVISATHNEHFNKTKVCTDCHGTLENSGNPMVGPLTHITASGANQGAILAGRALASLNEANVTRTNMIWTDLGNTCANSGGGLALGCHASGTPDWDVAINDCISCHTDETTPAVNPTSGLHNYSTATRHDDTLQTGACINCHDATSPSSLHMNGTLNNSSTATYTFNASNGITYLAANGCQANASCHADGGDWKRRWSGAIDAKPLATDSPGAAVCANCHGDFTNGWRWNEANASTTDHTDPNGDLTDQMSSNHGTCQNCHGWGDAAYNRTWATGQHGDGFITMNGPSPSTGSAYDNTTGGCALSCHGDIVGRRLNSNSGWTANYGNYGAGACYSCHGNGTNQYWPDGAVYPDKAGRHTIHITRLAAKLAITLPGTDLEQKRLCAYCHNDAAGIGASGHNTDSVPTGVADVGAINPIWDVTNPPTVADASSAFNTTDGSCSSIDCHNNKTLPAATFGWRDASTTTCTMCHTPGGASNDPTSGLHNLTPTVSGVRHDNTLSTGCTVCHTAIPTPGSGTHINNAFTGNGFIAGDKTNMGLIAAYTATVDNVGSCSGATVGGASCHAGVGDAGSWARKWDSTISGQSNGTECKGCHGGFAGTDWTFGATHNISDGSTEHNYSWDGDGPIEIVGNHKDNLANTSRCNVCHVYGDAGYVFGTNHRNGSLEMNSTRGYSAVTWNCTSTCHISNTNHNLEASGWTINPVAGPALACDSCHGGSGQYWPNNVSTAAGDYPNRKGRHDLHMTRLAAKLSYTLPGTDLQQKAMCDYCHNDASGSGGSGHDDRVAPANLGGFNLIWNAGADANGAYTSTAPGTCSNIDCHNSKATTAGTFGWYDSTTANCLLCHTPGAGNNPSSGLHNIVPTITGALGQHDDSFGTGGTNTCINCHTALPAMSPTTTHPNGAFTGNGTLAGDRTNMGLFSAYTTSGTDNTGTCAGGAVGGASCHAGTGDAGTWARKWNSAISAQTNGTECQGCHGGFAGTDWTFGSTHNISDGSTEHNYNWDLDGSTEIIGNHKDNLANTSRCSVCHVYADAPYGTLTTYHRNNTIEMNSTVEYSTTNFNCTGACHAANNTNHNLDTSGWTVNPIAGAALACSSCHGGGTTQGGGLFNYWPDGAAYPDIAGRHTIHMTRLAAKLGYTMGALTDLQQKTMCGYCHNDAAGVGGTGHNDSLTPANVGSFKHIGTGAADGGTAGSIAAGVCSNVDCHNNKATSGGYTWTGASTSVCLMCHTLGGASNDPTSGLHNVVPTTTSQQHDDSFATGGTCISCHTTLPAMSTTTTHINGSFTGNGFVAGDKTNMGLFAAYTASADNIGTCSGGLVGVASCHANIMDAGSWARLWDASIPGQTNGTECKGCHGGFAGTDWTFGGGAHNALDYNVEHNYSWDGDGSAEIIGNHKDNVANTSRCNICHVYGDTGYTWATNHRNGKITMNTQTTYSGTGFNCTAVCHVNNTNHLLEASSSSAWATRGETVAGPALACYTCHGGGTANSGSGFNYWPDGTTYPDTAGGSGTNRHLAHITKLAAKLNYTLATLTDQQQKTMCAFCHPYTTNPGESGHNDNVSPADVTAAAFNPLWSTITANYPATADGGTAASWTTATQQCSGIDCHNNQATSGTFAWNSTATSSCLLCHTVGGAGSNPTSGLHNVTPTVSGVRHDNTLSTGCIACHTTLPAVGPTSTHINNAFTGNGTIAGDKTNMGLFAAYTATADNIGSCSGAGVAGTSCHGNATYGVGDAGTWKRVWNSAVSGQTNGTECQGCHGGLSGSDWTFGVTSGAANTGDTNTDHMATYDGDGTSNEIAGNHGGTTQATRCNLCHVYADAGYNSTWRTGNHGNGSIQVNSTLGMTTVNRTCTTYCHTDNTGHVLDAGGWPVTTVAGPALTCSTCHATITTHIDADGAGAAYTSGTCTDCHTAHSGYRSGVNAANDVYISTISSRVVVGGGPDTGTPIPTMNNQYASHDSYIQLGGAATFAYAKSTEAEICWACHDANSISEWGTNSNTDTGSVAYDYGDLYTDTTGIPGTKTSNWTTGFWRSGKGRASGGASNPFWYKRGAIQSTHAANYGGTSTAAVTAGNTLGYNRTETKDAVANIRCTYCHDVHGTHNGVKGDTGTGQPYLRGTWLGNVYNEDGAPQWGMANWTVDAPTTTSYGKVPRGSAATGNSGLAGVSNAGGYWIDQNTGNPVAAHVNTTFRTASGNAGLCDQCHGTTSDGTWSAAEIGAIDQVASEGLWVSGYNGHANMVVGGAGRGTAASAESYARNIFTRTKRGSSSLSVASNPVQNADMGLATTENTRGFSYRSNSSGYGYSYYPRTSTTTTNAAGTGASYAMRYFVWNTTNYNTATTRGSAIAAGTVQLNVGNMTAGIGSGTNAETANYDAQANYHTFSCSKCHNPHASRLPKLMITNCLDTNHNTWDNAYQAATASAPWNASRLSQWASAQNCHRLDDRAPLATSPLTTRGTGWNKATPWQEYTSPDTTPAANPNP